MPVVSRIASAAAGVALVMPPGIASWALLANIAGAALAALVLATEFFNRESRLSQATSAAE